MRSEEIRMAAASLYEAAKKGNKIPSLSESMSLDEETAYAVSKSCAALYEENGEKSTGLKVALSNEAAQKKFGVEEPAYGYIYPGRCMTSGQTIYVRADEDYRVECELAFVMGQDMDQLPENSAQLAGAVEYLFPALELVTSRYQNPQIGFCDFVADNCNYGGAIFGDVIKKPVEIDPELLGMRLEVNGKLRTSGISAGVMGNPFHALRWLIEKRISHGMPVKAGEILLTGSFVPAEPIQAGDYVRASFYKMGDVCVSLAESV